MDESRFTLLEGRIEILEKRLQTAADIIVGQNANMHRLISIVERLREEIGVEFGP